MVLRRIGFYVVSVIITFFVTMCMPGQMVAALIDGIFPQTAARVVGMWLCPEGTTPRGYYRRSFGGSSGPLLQCQDPSGGAVVEYMFTYYLVWVLIVSLALFPLVVLILGLYGQRMSRVVGVDTLLSGKQPRQAPTKDSSIAARLDQLEQLSRSGRITPQEYQRKREEILRDL